MSAAQLTVPQAGCGCATPPAQPRKRVAQMTEEEKTRALLVDELTGLGNRRAWEDRQRLPVLAMLDVEGLKWVNDNVGWPAGDELLRAVAAAMRAEGVRACRLGGDEFVFEGAEEVVVAAQIDRIRGRLRDASIEAIVPDGSCRRLRGPRIHAGMGRSLDQAASALRDAKKAGVASGERAARGTRPRGLAEVARTPDSAPGLVLRVAGAFEAVRRFLGRADGPTYRFYLRALREADHAFDDGTQGSTSRMSLDWQVRNARRTSS
jgi:diguanylate cyclase (GGDEF)-like protein